MERFLSGMVNVGTVFFLADLPTPPQSIWEVAANFGIAGLVVVAMFYTSHLRELRMAKEREEVERRTQKEREEYEKRLDEKDKFMRETLATVVAEMTKMNKKPCMVEQHNARDRESAS